MTEEDSSRIIRLTEMLLKLVYEYPGDVKPPAAL
jgi:hypothetical protein